MSYFVTGATGFLGRFLVGNLLKRKGTVYVLERASDGAVASVRVSAHAGEKLAVSAGTTVTVSVVSTGVVLSALGEVIAFIPNELGRALLHNEQLTR